MGRGVISAQAGKILTRGALPTARDLRDEAIQADSIGRQNPPGTSQSDKIGDRNPPRTSQSGRIGDQNPPKMSQADKIGGSNPPKTYLPN